MAHLLLIAIIAILVLDYLLDLFLEYLNSTRWSDEVPPELEGIYDAEKYRRSQEYERANRRFSIISGTFSLAVTLLVLFFGLLGTLDGWLRRITEHPALLAILFFAAAGLAADLLHLPFEAYGTFVIEKRFGFNKTTPRTFVLDKIKGLLLSAVIGGVLTFVIVQIYEYAGNMFWIYAWLVAAAFSILMAMFYSELIVPVFNKQTPLPEGSLRTSIEKFAAKAGFKLKDVYVIDGSKRSTKANAYFSGLGPRKRIVLFDTLIKDHPEEEIVAVLAHEVGHYKLKHTAIGMACGLVQAGLMLFILSVFIAKESPLSFAICQALGGAKASFHLGVTAFAFLFSPVSMLMGLAMNMASRSFEYSADRFAGLGFGAAPMMAALKRLSVNHLSNLRPHPAYVFFHYSHPPLLDRLRALDGLRGK